MSFTSSQPHDLDRILDGLEEVVTDEMRADLAQAYTSEEVDAAIKEMAPLKAPGPDGMPRVQMVCPLSSFRPIGLTLGWMFTRQYYLA